MSQGVIVGKAERFAVKMEIEVQRARIDISDSTATLLEEMARVEGVSVERVIDSLVLHRLSECARALPEAIERGEHTGKAADGEGGE